MRGAGGGRFRPAGSFEPMETQREDDAVASEAGGGVGPPPPCFAEPGADDEVPSWMRWSWVLGLLAAVVSFASILLTLRVLEFLRP